VFDQGGRPECDEKGRNPDEYLEHSRRRGVDGEGDLAGVHEGQAAGVVRRERQDRPDHTGGRVGNAGRIAGTTRAPSAGRRVATRRGRGDGDHRHHRGVARGVRGGFERRPLLDRDQDVVVAGKAE